MDFKERINQLALALGQNKTMLQEQMGVSNAYFSNVTRVSGKVAAKLKQLYPKVNIDWLNEGNGEMFLDQEVPINQYTVPLLPVVASAGSLSEFAQGAVYDFECERIISPVKDAKLALTVNGESMSPEFPNGSKVLLRHVDEKLFIEWGKTYVLDTQNGIVIKNVFPSDKEGYIICRSINPLYKDFEVNTADIIGWYRVVMQISMK